LKPLSIAVKFDTTAAAVRRSKTFSILAQVPGESEILAGTT
jgi:hypothetical protein